MSGFLGIDTSNYTTSAAIFDDCENQVIQRKKLLPVKSGALGLKQSDAVFSHTVQLPDLVEDVFREYDGTVKAVAVSNRPRDIEGSYMPCFLAGMNAARSAAAALHVPIYYFSHQSGHIAAALYSASELDLTKKKFIAFHVSGGTTEALLVTPDENSIIKEEIIAKSLDLKAGQAVDRVGVMLGLDFPAGALLDRLACGSKKAFKIRPTMKGADCCLSGVENKCRKMFDDGECKEDIARFCIDSVLAALDEMASMLIKEYGELPIVFAGGVMSNSIIRERLGKKYGAYFAKPEFSSDNAAGIAVLAKIKTEGI